MADPLDQAGDTPRRCRNQACWRTVVRVLLLTFIYAKLQGWALGAAVAAAIWQV